MQAQSFDAFRAIMRAESIDHYFTAGAGGLDEKINTHLVLLNQLSVLPKRILIRCKSFFYYSGHAGDLRRPSALWSRPPVRVIAITESSSLETPHLAVASIRAFCSDFAGRMYSFGAFMSTQAKYKTHASDLRGAPEGFNTILIK